MRPQPTLLLVAALLLGSAALPTAAALPTPGFFCEASDASLGRVFPEAMETNDYVSYDEAKCGLELLMQENPDRLKIDVVGQSVGWDNAMGGHDTFDVFVARVSDYTSEIPDEDKIRIVFQLSIHGNEKGGREGGLRVIEDFVRQIGSAEEYPQLLEYLTFMEILFVFPQPDGWIHEEFQYRHNDACYFSVTNTCGEAGVETQSFVRVNGNGVDVNREWPTIGWVRDRHTPMSEPEAIALVGYLKQVPNVKYASDIHGMLNPADGTALNSVNCFPNDPEEVLGFDPTCFPNAVSGSKGHYVLTMLPAGRQDPREMTTNTALAELVKEYLNGNPHYAEWQNLPNSLGGAWGGEFNDWGTVWDTIGYTDSGFTSDWYAQDHGLNAAGVDFELSYNHVTFDNYYPGAAQRMNDYHVEITRDIVRAFMDQAALDVQTSIDTKGTRTAFIDNPYVLTNADNLTVEGWAAENTADDAFDIGHVVYRASPNDYFLDLQKFAASGDQPGIIDALRAGDAGAQALGLYDNLVIAGSAYKALADNPAAVAGIKAWVEAGGNLVVTDEALQMLVDLGIVEEGAVDVELTYAGATNFVDRAHELAQGIRGLARETFEPVPVGFAIDSLSAPGWYVAADKFSGEVVGVHGQGQGSNPDPSKVNFGRAKLGEGTVSFLGALLPDPVNEGTAFYGVDSYATTYTGNQLLRNMLGWDVVFGTVPVAPAELGSARTLEGGGTAGASVDAEQKVPGLGFVGIVALAALAIALRRRK